MKKLHEYDQNEQIENENENENETYENEKQIRGKNVNLELEKSRSFLIFSTVVLQWFFSFLFFPIHTKRSMTTTHFQQILNCFI